MVILFIPYLQVDLPIFQQAYHPVSRFLCPFPGHRGVIPRVRRVRWPVWALAFFFATGPLANGLVACDSRDPGLHKQAESSGLSLF
jgi:hypothetical protein